MNKSPDISTTGKLTELARRAVGIARNSHLVAINMRSLHVELSDDSDVEQRVSLDSQHHAEHLFMPEQEDAPARLKVRVHFELKVRDTESARALFSLKATLEAEYSLNRNMPQEAVDSLDAFAETNAVLNVWPYYRELVQSMTWRMGLPPLPLPLFRISDSAQEAAQGKKPI